MGKKNFQAIFKAIKEKTNGDIVCEVDERSVKFKAHHDYIGLIIYAVDSSVHWNNTSTKHIGKSFSLIVQEPLKWKQFFSGKPFAHSKFLRFILSSDDKKALCGGFWFENGELNFGESIINQEDQKGLDGNSNVTDGNLELSLAEQTLVRFCWEKYKNEGPGSVFFIDEKIQQDILDEPMVYLRDTVWEREQKLLEKEQQSDVRNNTRYPTDLTEEMARANVASNSNYPVQSSKDDFTNFNIRNRFFLYKIHARGQKLFQENQQTDVRNNSKYPADLPEKKAQANVGSKFNNPAKSSEYDFKIFCQGRFLKFMFFKNGIPFTFHDFIYLYSSGSDSEAFTQVLISALKRANEELTAYLWECPPIHSKNIDKQQFEFVVNESLDLDSPHQDWSPFHEHFERNKGKMVCNFPNLGGDAILVVPLPMENEVVIKNYKNLSRFTDNASFVEQHSLWQRVAEVLHDCIDSEPKWLSTHGKGVHYLCIRVDDRPKYYTYLPYTK